MKQFYLKSIQNKKIAFRLRFFSLPGIVIGLRSCSSGKNEGMDLIIKYIDQYHEKLQPLEHDIFVTYRIKNLESHTDQLIEISNLIVSQIRKGDRVEETTELEQEANNLVEYSSEFKKVCMAGKEREIEDNIKKLQESCDKLINMAAELSSKE